MSFWNVDKIGTGHGIIISIPYKGRDVILDEKVNIGYIFITLDDNNFQTNFRREVARLLLSLMNYFLTVQ